MAVLPLRRFGALAATLALAGAGLTAPASASSPQAFGSTPPGENITIDVVTANGTGCRPGTAEAAWSPDNTAVTITYSDYVVETGPGATNAARKNCQLMLNLHIPNGYSYGVVQADYRGMAKVAKGATGYQEAKYYFQGSSGSLNSFSPIKGPVEKDYTFTDRIGFENVVWSPCGNTRYLGINTVLRLDKGTSKEHSIMTVDSTDISVATKIHIAWKKC